MLLIHCPYCGDRARARVPLRRRGAYRPAGRSRARSATRTGPSSCIMRTNPKGLHAERWRHIHGCAPLLQRRARHRDRQDSSRPTRSASRGPTCGRRGGGRDERSAFRTAERRPHRPRQAGPLHLRRQRLSGLRRRHARLGAARQRRAPRRPLVQISSPARHPGRRLGGAERAGRRRSRRRRASTPNLRATQVELYDGLVADSQNRWPSLDFDVGAINDLLSPLLRRRLLLQDLHVAARASGRRSTSRRSAPPPASAARPKRPDPDRYTQPLRPLRRAGGRRRPGRPRRRARRGRAGARVILCDEQAELGGSLLAETQRRPSTASRRATGLADVIASLALNDQRHAAAAHHGLRLLHPQLRRRSPSGSPTISPRPTRACRASGCGRCAPSRWCWRPARIERPLVFPDNDRPGIMLAEAARDLRSIATACWPGARAVVVTACMTAPIARRSTSQAAGVAIAAHRRSARRDAGAAVAGGARRPASASCRRTTRDRHQRPPARRRASASGASARTAPSAPRDSIACDLVLMSGGWTPAVHLFSQSRGKLASTRRAQASCPARSHERERSAGACRGVFDLAAVHRRRLCGRRTRRPRAAGVDERRHQALRRDGDTLPLGRLHRRAAA